MKWYEDPVYHKMCERFAKINEVEWENGDYFYCPDSDKVIIYNFVYTNVAEIGNFVVKLFRQDQLQKMVIGKLKRKIVKEKDYVYPRDFSNAKIVENNHKNYPEYYLLSEFNYFVNSNRLKHAMANIYSMEQLWFAFVMKENYNKIWNGEGWIKE